MVYPGVTMAAETPPRNAPENPEERFRRVGEKASEVKRVAYESYSKAADVVRQRALELDDAIHRRGTAEAVERRREALGTAVRVKELAQHEHEAADRNWSEWLDEHRARQEDERLERQATIARSAMWAAWAAALAAFMSLLVAVWQVFGAAVRAALHR